MLSQDKSPPVLTSDHAEVPSYRCAEMLLLLSPEATRTIASPLCGTNEIAARLATLRPTLDELPKERALEPVPVDRTAYR
jgi:hypothetical protein